jgi:hypothetical protein
MTEFQLRGTSGTMTGQLCSVLDPIQFYHFAETHLNIMTPAPDLSYRRNTKKRSQAVVGSNKTKAAAAVASESPAITALSKNVDESAGVSGRASAQSMHSNGSSSSDLSTLQNPGTAVYVPPPIQSALLVPDFSGSTLLARDPWILIYLPSALTQQNGAVFSREGSELL